MIVYSDTASDLYTFGVPRKEDHPPTLYSSLDAAKRVLSDMAKKYQRFVPVAYGKCYPYEETTFERHLAVNGSAPFGWGTFYDGDDEYSVGIHLLRVAIN